MHIRFPVSQTSSPIIRTIALMFAALAAMLLTSPCSASPSYRVRALQLASSEHATRATALATADWTGDGIADLAVAYASESGGGEIAMYPGNPVWYEYADAQRPAAIEPFLDPVQIITTPQAADHLLAGDFTGNGRIDLIAATVGARSIALFAMDQTHRFGDRRERTLSGSVTNIATGEVDRADGLADLAVALNADDGASILVLSSAQGAFDAPAERYASAAPIDGLAIVRMDRGAGGGIAYGAGSELFVLGAREGLAAGAVADRDALPPRSMHSFALGARAAMAAAVPGSGLVLALADHRVMTLAAPQTSIPLAAQSPVRVQPAASSSLDIATDAALSASLRGAAALTVHEASVRSGGASLLIPAIRGASPLLLDGMRLRSVDGRIDASLALPGNAVAGVAIRLSRAVRSDVLLATAGSVRIQLAMPLAGPTLVVNSTADSDDGACAPAPDNCTLREAINAANATSDATIVFTGLTAGNHTILPSAALPFLQTPITMDGATHPDGRVEIDGSNAGSAVNGLNVIGGNTTIRGLVVNAFSYSGISLSAAGGNIIEGNFVGTDFNGTAPKPNLGNGIQVYDVPDNLIGGTTAAARNVVSGNYYPGVSVYGVNADGNTVSGNYIGVDVTGGVALSNTTENLHIGGGGSNNIIGGTVAGSANVISANGDASYPNLAITGVPASDSDPGTPATGNLLQGNLIGTDASGAVLLGNLSVGVFIANNAPGNTVGGNSPAAANTIVGSSLDGVRIGSATSIGNVVAGNFIGTTATGASGFGNQGHGIYLTVNPVSTVIGTATAGNTIAGNGKAGVFVDSGSANAIRFNSIFGNVGLGIDLCADFDTVNRVCNDAAAVTPNDAGDADGAANALQNFPIMQAAVKTATQLIISASLHSTPNAVFTVQWFGNDACNARGYGVGARYLGEQTGNTDASGNGLLQSALALQPAAGSFVTATATDALGNTSEFSACLPVVADSIFADDFD